MIHEDRKNITTQWWKLKNTLITFHAPRNISGEHIVAALSVRPYSPNSDFKTVLQKWPPCWDDVSLPWRSRSQRDIAAKSCPAHNVVIWSLISTIFHRNDHHFETTCRVQHLGRYLEGQGHSMTLQQNRVRPITVLFEVGFRKYFPKIITILRQCVARNIWVATLKVKVIVSRFSKIVSGP